MRLVGLLSSPRVLTNRAQYEPVVSRVIFSGTTAPGNQSSRSQIVPVASMLLNELGFPPDIIELQLAHQERNEVRAAHNRAQRLDERRKMMQAWADYLEGLRVGSNVVPFRRPA
jgi:hypothetical protein